MDVTTLLRRGRDRLGAVAVRVRDRRVVAPDGLAAIRVAGSWNWFHELPAVPRDELRARHLATVVDALDRARLDHFVVPDPLGRRPQVGVPAEQLASAIAAVTDATAGQAWYASDVGDYRLLARTSPADTRTVRVFPQYRASGTRYLAGGELSVALVPWDREDGVRVPDARNAHLSHLRDVDFDDRARAYAHGRWWPSLTPFASPHPEARPPMRWLVVVPPRLREQNPELADLLGRYAARSVWFHAASGSAVTLLDTPTWLRHEHALPVSPPADGDLLDGLVTAWAEDAAPAGVLPAGALLVGDRPARRLVSPGGLGLFRPAPERLAPRGPATGADRDAEVRAARDWFHRRTGSWMPFSVGSLPVGLPAPDADLRAEVEEVVADPDRPAATNAETAMSVLLWVAHLRGRAVPGPLPAAHHRAGSRRFTRGMASLARSSGRSDAVGVDLDSLVEVDGAPQHFTTMAAHRLPRPAPWEGGDPDGEGGGPSWEAG